MRRLKFVEVAKTRHGKEAVYFRRRKGLRIRLPDLTSPNFRRCYDAAMAGAPIPHLRDMPVTAIALRKQRCERAMVAAVRAARTRARKRGFEFDLTVAWALDQAQRQQFRCALTGIEFYAAHGSTGKVNPYVPSFDRIKAGGGYTQDNVRIVVLAINLMLLDWGDAVFEQVANSYRYWKRTK